MEGVFAANGPAIRSRHKVQAEMADVAPTLLAAMGLAVPSDMEGRVLTELFNTPPEVVLESPAPAQQGYSMDSVYSEQDQAILTQRLSDLGYLE